MWIYPPDIEDEAHPAKCRSCGAPIVWAMTKAGAKTPLNADYKIASTQQVGGAELVEIERGGSHFSTCPQKHQWRKKK